MDEAGIDIRPSDSELAEIASLSDELGDEPRVPSDSTDERLPGAAESQTDVRSAAGADDLVDWETAGDRLERERRINWLNDDETAEIIARRHDPPSEH